MYKMINRGFFMLFFLAICLFSNASIPGGEGEETKEKAKKSNTEGKLSSKIFDNSTKISFINYNIWGLPVWLPGIQRKKRYPFIERSLEKRNADIVGLQETFHRFFRRHIAPKINQKYNCLSDYKCNRGFLKTSCQGGLINFSKLPILEENFFAHPNVEGKTQIEKTGGKGLLISKLESKVGPIIIVNLHLYSGDGMISETIRLQEVMKLESILDSMNYNEMPIFMFGDFNMINPDYSYQSKKCLVYPYLMNEMDFTDIQEGEKIVSYDYEASKYLNGKANNKKGVQLDYFIYKLPDNFAVGESQCEVIFKEDENFSDHYGLLTNFELIKKFNKKKKRKN